MNMCIYTHIYIYMYLCMVRGSTVLHKPGPFMLWMLAVRCGDRFARKGRGCSSFGFPSALSRVPHEYLVRQER